ncbi:MAG: hypothetical protein JO077_00240 [Verrucomicrobia bacterium]|nr:hypothetical protein [Verrucomicrobiota bacterium]
MNTYLECSEVVVIDQAKSVKGARKQEIRLIPRGSFAGTIYQLGLVRNGDVVACDSGEQGGGQN